MSVYTAAPENMAALSSLDCSSCIKPHYGFQSGMEACGMTVAEVNIWFRSSSEKEKPNFRISYSF